MEKEKEEKEDERREERDKIRKPVLNREMKNEEEALIGIDSSKSTLLSSQ